jgi:hypothetical protein
MSPFLKNLQVNVNSAPDPVKPPCYTLYEMNTCTHVHIHTLKGEEGGR